MVNKQKEKFLIIYELKLFDLTRLADVCAWYHIINTLI